MKRWLLPVMAAAALARAQQGVIHVNVDASDAPRRLIHVQLAIPAAAGPMTLLYPQWIPGEHAPTGPIADLVALKMRARNQTVAWTRDSTNLYAFRVNVPAGSAALDVAFDFISAADAGGFSSGSSITTELAVLSWNQFVLYPQGAASDQLQYQASLRIPRGWRYGTALPVAKESGEEIEFRPSSLTTLIDSPVSTGAHFRTIELGTLDGAPHFIHIAADSERALAMTPEQIAQYKNLVAEAGALFGSRHYRGYHFLLTLSDHVASFGLEHHESSDDRLEERTLVDDGLRQKNADLLPHEFVHSWNGKYRRPAGLATKDYSEPMKGDLLWVYEGLTEYLGEVLAARSGLESADRFRDWLAYAAAHLDHESGRAWRSLADTAVSAQLLYDAREDYSGLRRGVDFYSEGALVWLEVDVLLRQLSHGAKSIDDFTRAFHGGAGGAAVVKPYTLDDLVAALKAIQPYDWAGFFRDRVESVDSRGPLAGLEKGGWKLLYTDKRSDYWTAVEDERKVADLTFSLGLTVKNEGGGVADVVIGGPAHNSGIAPGANVTSVNGRQFTAAGLREAVQSAAASADDPIELQVKNGEYFSTHRVDYHGGEKYPHLERDNGKPDLLAEILKPRAKK